MKQAGARERQLVTASEQRRKCRVKAKTETIDNVSLSQPRASFPGKAGILCCHIRMVALKYKIITHRNLSKVLVNDSLLRSR